MQSKTLKYCEYQHVHSNNILNGVLIENEDDIEQYSNIIKYYGQRTVKKFLRSGVPPESFDHIIGGFQPHEKQFGQLAYRRASVNGKNPIAEVDPVLYQYLKSLKNVVSNYDRAIINENGGIHIVTPDLITINKIYHDKWQKSNINNYRILENTQVINLENDYFLEDKSKRYIEKILEDNNFSFIKELSLFETKDLEKVFQEFKEKEDILYTFILLVKM